MLRLLMYQRRWPQGLWTLNSKETLPTGSKYE